MDDLPQLTFMRTARVTDKEFNELVGLLEESDFEWFTKSELNFTEKRRLVGLINQIKA